MLNRNQYNTDLNGYDTNHPNAISDGDELGKGENNGNIGGLTDINTRTDNKNRNLYNDQNGYSLVHPNAISDGDEKGRAENNNSVGTLTDNNERTAHVARNPYNSSQGYPDF